MRHAGRFAVAISLSLTIIAASAGCAEEQKKAAPELPKQFCWNAFDRGAVQSILPTGDRLTHDADIFYFAERKKSSNCLVYVNGNDAFSAFAKFQDDEFGFDWSSFDRLKPDPVRIGKKAIAWDTGAITYFPCRATANSGPSTARYLELTIYTTPAKVENQRKSLPHLLKQFTAFAQKELKCA
ncbi:hypothetical protein GTW37_33875 [Streptomyces sp. SID4931]|nr:hypothetical protein [Streptomyces sp. SID4931]SCG07751.1 hypothetical protein GA0115255_1231019 [Streptomyces sp. Ncost-T6T-2b]